MMVNGQLSQLSKSWFWTSQHITNSSFLTPFFQKFSSCSYFPGGARLRVETNHHRAAEMGVGYVKVPRFRWVRLPWKSHGKNLGSKGKTMGKSLVPRVLPEFPVLGMNIHEQPDSFMRKNKKGQHFDPNDGWPMGSAKLSQYWHHPRCRRWYPLVI